MLLTKAEAENTQCPQTMTGPKGLRVPCVTTHCMAWRWIGLPAVKVRGAGEATVEPPRPANVPATWKWQPYDPTQNERAAWVQPEDEAALERKGFCGLAGRPE